MTFAKIANQRIVLLTWFLMGLLGGYPALLFALPEGGEIVSGSGEIHEHTDGTMEIHQNTDQMIINWQGYNIGTSESITYLQPGSTSTSLNNIFGGASTINGQLSANGQIFLYNPSGILFGPTARVNVGALMASTLAISDQDFLKRLYNFYQDPDKPLSSIINEGIIQAGGYAGMLAPAVENRGTIVTSLGSVALASGKAATMDFIGDGLINFVITEEVSGAVTDTEGNVMQDRVSNTGLIRADGGLVTMTARDAGDVIRNVVNQEGVIEARTVMEKEGRIFLSGGSQGIVNVSGTLDASGNDSGEKGGTVHVLGEKVGLFETARVDVSGDAGGGTALIGGDFQGSNPDIQNAFRTYVGEGAVIEADAITTGDGGKVIVWADDVTRYYGSISASGGSVSGDGGFVEVSGKRTLDFQGNVELAAFNGTGGTLLLDPANITISTGADTNTNGFTAMSDNTEAFTDDSGLDSVFDITASTGSFNNVGNFTTIKLQATNNITVSSDWNVATSTGNTNVSIQLEALNNVEAPASGQLRYCSHCWSVFRSNGEMFTPKSGGA